MSAARDHLLHAAHSNGRGVPRREQSAFWKPGLSGANLDRRAACLDELGVSFVALCCLVALTVRARHGCGKTTRATLDDLVKREEGLSVAGALRDLERYRLAREVGRLGNAVVWEVTAAGERKINAWAGREP
jgi:hypothetical protein